ncbi:MAG: penicillin-binding protein 1C [Chloroflexi bacterium]|nr:penicillin-binding protein 1C [Chloroflexota bacterium]
MRSHRFRFARIGSLPQLRLILALIFVLPIMAAIVLRSWLFTDLPELDSLEDSLHTPSMRITDRHGRLLYEVIGEEAGRHSVVPLEDIPQSCRDATIATEDANFYRNPGVDGVAILRAVWINLRGGEVISGGSTITQQVARNHLLDPQERAERTLTRKLRESILAFRLSRAMSKDEILALYLNQTYYGNLAYGMDAAARAYFAKPLAQLALSECALLAGLPQAPSLYDPLTDPAAAYTRQAVVLALMADNGMISQEQADSAARDELRFAAERYAIEAPHFVGAVYDQMQATLPPEVFYGGGLRIRTTLDLDWQNEAQTIAAHHLALLNRPELGSPPSNAHGAAIVAMDPHTGQVLTMLGSPDFFDVQHSGAVNMALAPRQPGSTLKPFTYAAAFDPARPRPWSPATMLLDVRRSFVTEKGYAYTPVNYDRREHGPVLVREALASSYNIPAVIALEHIGIDALLSLLQDLGISTAQHSDDIDLSLALGGGEVRLLELTAAYGALANGGQALQPILVLDVRSTDGEVIWRSSSPQGDQVLDERVTWLVSDILGDNYARAPGFTTHSILQIGRPAAAKTGTTTDFRDNWTMGYTPNLVVGVWVGNPDNSSMEGISGVSGAGPIWHEFMRAVLRDQPELDFERPAGLVQIEVCSLSGLLPSDACPYTQLEWVIPGSEPTDLDTFYQTVLLDSRSGLLANADTPREFQVDQTVLNLPPQAQAWARREGLPLYVDVLAASGIDPANPVEPGDLTIINPDPQTIFRLTDEQPLAAQRIRLMAVGPAGLRDVRFYLDGNLLGQVDTPPFEMWWPLVEGDHRLYASAIDAEGERVRSAVVTFRVNPAE